jgi:A/G-specific adenine glycosylase
VWLSEIMLQQTTVVAVKPYFERFLNRFPDVASLAAASEDEVLRLWEGLGYYSRARNLRKAAQQIVRNGIAFPSTVDELMRLPGIGRYTAGAIVSFAFNRPAPILEANTLRLYCRLLGFRDDPRSTSGQRTLWSLAEKLVPLKQPGEFNQALTDLGAIVCTPTEPQCHECPVATCCRAFGLGAQADIPQPARRPEVTEVSEAFVAIESAGHFLLIHQPEGVRWAGLWDFPRFELDDVPTKRQPVKLECLVAESFGLRVEVCERLTQLKHSVTRYRITLDCWRAELAGPRDVASKLTFAWVAPEDFASYPLSVTGRKLADLIARDHAEPNLVLAAQRRKK